MESHVKFADGEKIKGRRPSADTSGRPLLGQDGPSDGTQGPGSIYGTTKGETQKNSVYFRASLPAGQRMSRHDGHGGRSSAPPRQSQGRASTKSIANIASKSRKSLGPRPSEVLPNARLNAPDMKRTMTDKNHERLALNSSFDASELRMLGRRFRKLDQNNDGNLTLQEFMSIPELQSNPLVSRVIKIFDLDGNGLVSFNEFVNGMSVFSGAADRISTLRFAFKVYDMDKDGYISNGELFQVLRMMVGDNLGDTELQQVVDKTILYGDHDGDGRISFKEFCSMIGEIGIDQKMVLLNL